MRHRASIFPISLLILILVLSKTVSAAGSSAFVSTWRTITSNESITIPTFGSGYNYHVSWGDGHGAQYTGSASHSYSTPGAYTVSITGDFPRIYFNNSGHRNKILSIEKWGDIQWGSMERAFYGCENLVADTSDRPDLSNVESTSYMFRGATSFDGDSLMNSWNMSNVTDTSYMFFGAKAFNHDISDWNVSNVENMAHMFNSAVSFNRNLGDWNVSSVTDMKSMFYGAVDFDQDIGDWNVANITDMSRMFYNAESFNEDIGDWNVVSVNLMTSMFQNASAFNQELLNWNVRNVTDMSYMFANAGNFNTKLNGWNVSSVDSMAFMFAKATSFHQDISDWNVSGVEDMSYMFYKTASYRSSVEDWNVNNVLTMRGMFFGANAFNGDISDWNINQITDTADMFGSSKPIATDDPSAVSTSGNYSNSDSGSNAFDGVNSIAWASKLWETPAWIAYDFEEAKRVSSYTIVYSNGSIRTRAPKEFSLQGSNNGTSWATLDTRTNETSWGGSESRTYSVASPGFYSEYRLMITDDNDNRSGIVLITMGELIFETDTLDTTSSLATGNPSAVATSGNYSSSASGWKSFDGINSTMWGSTVWATPAWISYDFEEAHVVNKYTIVYSNGSIRTRAPKEFTLQGSNNGTSWATLDTRTNETNWGGLESRSYSVASPGAYSEYRLMITDDNDNRSGIVMISIGELILESDRLDSSTIINTNDPSAASTSGNFNSSAAGWKSFDGINSTMWGSQVWQNPAWIRYDFEEAKRVSRYTIIYTNGSILTRAPKEFSLQGSSNGTSWEDIDTRTNETGWSGSESRTYSVASPGLYSDYRLMITDDNDNRSGIVMISIGELVFE